MANLTKQFDSFHKTIAITPALEKKILAGKRDIILDKLSESIVKRRKNGKDIPTYTHRNQGSYAMDTGIKPVSGEDYDLDVALLFDLDQSKFDPLTVKGWVHSALRDHTKEVRWREPCVTVFYSQNDEHVYHVDFAVYSSGNPDERCYLARGKEHSTDDNKKWEEADPTKLIETLKNHFTDSNDRAQFRRVIRYLKRWKDVKFPYVGNSAPTGIAITGCALCWFEVSKYEDLIANTTTYDDHVATLALVKSMLSHFEQVYDSETQQFVDRLRVSLPVPPENDIFDKMTNKQMTTFKQRLEDLRDNLVEAQSDIDPHTAAKTLSKEFGTDFPVPEKKDTAESLSKAITSSGGSA